MTKLTDKQKEIINQYGITSKDRYMYIFDDKQELVIFIDKLDIQESSVSTYEDIIEQIADYIMIGYSNDSMNKKEVIQYHDDIITLLGIEKTYTKNGKRVLHVNELNYELYKEYIKEV